MLKTDTAFPDHDSFIAWPNGGGETPCSALYAQTADAQEEADRLAAQAEDDEDWPGYGEHSMRAEQLRAQLHDLREAGHLGRPLTYDRPSPTMALLGGAAMTADGRVFHNDTFIGAL